MAVELSITLFRVCREANGQFCRITTPFQPLAIPPSCVSALYARNPAVITSLQMFTANKENFRCQPTNTDISKCLDAHDSTLYTSKHHHINMS